MKSQYGSVAERGTAPNRGACTNTKMGEIQLLRKLDEPSFGAQYHGALPTIESELVHDLSQMPFDCLFTYCPGNSHLLADNPLATCCSS